MAKNSAGVPGTLSIVIASYNSAPWLTSTLSALADALAATTWTAEVIVVNDGSTDDTVAVLNGLRSTLRCPLRVITQTNKGRFLARWEGVRSAIGEDVLVLDSRVLIHRDSLACIRARIEDSRGVRAWNGHVDTDSDAPLVGHFWSVPTYVFWGTYLARPRPMLITRENFDRVPKGTGFFLVKKELFQRACTAVWPEGDPRLVSDDTRLLRFIVAEGPIALEPGFSATYRPRTRLKAFLEHAWQRGTFFVDSYAGTGAARNAILIAIGLLPFGACTAAGWLAAKGEWAKVGALGAACAASLAVPLVVAAVRKCPSRALLSYAVFVLPFGAFFTAGLLRGLVVHRSSLLTRSPLTDHQGVDA